MKPYTFAAISAVLFLLFRTALGQEVQKEALPMLNKTDPLYKALQDLQQEVEELRGEIRGTQSNRPAKKTANRPAMRSPVQPKQNERSALETLLESENGSQTQVVTIAPATSAHWSFQPVQSPSPPRVRNRVRNEVWVRDDLDRFILADLEQAGVEPNRDADWHTLIRRVAFDLTGLPPTEEEIRDFVGDNSSLDKASLFDEALARLVDQYLDSPRFGERWGRHWLDVVRYADSVGRNWNAPFTYAWRYRNYVIDAFNKDKPYDQFIAEQLAGDLLPADDLVSRREQIIATGFLALGPIDIIEPEGESLMMDRIDEQIDVTTRAMLALTVSCARCHDHKYEPITMRDYYALAGVFYSTKTMSGQRRGNYVADERLLILPSADGRTSPIPGVHSMADITREFRSGGWREVFYTTDANLAMGAVEGRGQDCPIRLDGEAYKRGPTPPRGDFRIAGLSGLEGVAPDSSGRLQLARWITSPENPLTARVMVNRIWRHLFGQGLVNTIDNFGVSGEEPTHPQLLDHLATRFRKTWSVKSLIRSIVLSRTYRLSSQGKARAQQIDPQNKLYWRMNQKRLEVEALRDAMLAAAGRLSPERPEGIQVAGTGGKGRWALTRSLLSINSPYRTVYLPVLRSLLPEMYSTFDFPDPTQITGRREVTTVAPQSLFLMNSDFAAGCARDAARRLLDEKNHSDADRIRLIYLRLLGRQPDDEEVDSCQKLIASLAPPSTVRDDELYRWSTLVQAVMICGEFRTLL